MKLKFFLANIFLFVFNFFAFATDDGFEGGDDVDLPPPSRDVGAQATPIDMYDGILLGVAIILILGYYYSKRRRIVNS